MELWEHAPELQNYLDQHVLDLLTFRVLSFTGPPVYWLEIFKDLRQHELPHIILSRTEIPAPLWSTNEFKSRYREAETILLPRDEPLWIYRERSRFFGRFVFDVEFYSDPEECLKYSGGKRITICVGPARVHELLPDVKRRRAPYVSDSQTNAYRKKKPVLWWPHVHGNQYFTEHRIIHWCGCSITRVLQQTDIATIIKQKLPTYVWKPKTPKGCFLYHSTAATVGFISPALIQKLNRVRELLNSTKGRCSECDVVLSQDDPKNYPASMARLICDGLVWEKGRHYFLTPRARFLFQIHKHFPS